jgi:hypothetical protein
MDNGKLPFFATKNEDDGNRVAKRKKKAEVSLPSTVYGKLRFGKPYSQRCLSGALFSNLSIYGAYSIWHTFLVTFSLKPISDRIRLVGQIWLHLYTMLIMVNMEFQFLFYFYIKTNQLFILEMFQASLNSELFYCSRLTRIRH